MSPLSLRRYRAERMLRADFERLQASVLRGVSRRLRAAGVRLDERDLQACYAQAWQGLYGSILDGREIADPEAWLALVSYRRALDEHRTRRRAARVALDAVAAPRRDASASRAAGARLALAEQRDLAEQLDDRVRLRQLFEGLRGRLSLREQQAATLCYLQGLSRAEAAARMGVSEARMRKLMEGRGAGAPGVARKVGVLVETIGAGRWCEEQGSLMRGFAFGILDPQGERHRLAELHQSECPACRSYVLSLRGIAAVVPPLPSLLHLVLSAGALTTAAVRTAGAGAAGAVTARAGSAAAGSAASSSGSGVSAGAGSGVGAGALSASGAAGTAGGGWWLAGGPLGAKLAVGCVLALGVGASCVALERSTPQTGALTHRRHAGASTVARRASAVALPALPARQSVPGAGSRRFARPESPKPARSLRALAAQAPREFGPEQPAAREGTASNGARPPSPAPGPASLARVAASVAASARQPETSATSATSSTSAGSGASAVPAATHEFAPG